MIISFERMRTLIRCEQRLKRRYGRLFAKATDISVSLTGMPHGSGIHSKVESGAVEMVEAEEVYREAIDTLTAMRAELDELLPDLEDSDDIAVIRYRYIYGYDLDMIPEKMALSERAMFYHLSSAEKKLLRLFPEKVVK